MPEFVPAPQLPTGMAEKLLDMQSQAGAPWAALLQHLGQVGGNVLTQKADIERQRVASMTTPEEMQALNLRQPAPGPTQPGHPSPTMKVTQPMRLSLAEKMAAQQNSQAIQGQKTAEADKLGMMTVSPEAAATPAFQKLGLTAGSQIPKQTYDALAKPPAAGAGKAQVDQGNMKAVTDYASKNGISLDALRPGGMGGWNSNNLAMVAQMIKDHPDYDAASLKKEFAGQLAASTRGAGTTAATAASMKVNLDSAHSAFSAVMDMAKPLADAMGKDQIGIFNKLIQQGGTEFNDENSVALNAYLDMAAGNYARITKGGTASISDEDKQDAKKVLSKKLNSGGIEAVQKAMDVEYKGRISGLPGGKKEAPAADKKKAPASDPATRFQELIKSGKSEDEAYKTLAAEGH